MIEIRKILFPVDFIENSSKLLPYVLSMAEKYDSRIYILHVVPNIDKWGVHFIPHPSMKTFQQEAMEGAEKAMEKLCNEQLKGCTNFERILVTGDPAMEILRIIEEEDIDLVMMGTHGRKGLEQVIFGSVAENVVKKSPAPVLVINPHKIG